MSFCVYSLRRRGEMKVVYFILLFCSLGANASGIQVNTNCEPPNANEEYLYNSDFHWGYGLDEMRGRFKEVYDSGKRLKDRAYYDKQLESYVLVHNTINGRKPVKIEDHFIASVQRHIENALNLNYVDGIFFPDMGHSHLLVTHKVYEEKIKDMPVADMHLAYEIMLADKNTHFLYHTAEQLQTLDKQNNLLPGKYLQWRYYTRNLVGNNYSDSLMILNNFESKANTVNTPMPNKFKWWSAGYNLTANKKGCFSYTFKGKTYYFDISLEDLPSKGGSYFSKEKVELFNVKRHPEQNMTIGEWLESVKF